MGLQKAKSKKKKEKEVVLLCSCGGEIKRVGPEAAVAATRNIVGKLKIDEKRFIALTQVNEAMLHGPYGTYFCNKCNLKYSYISIFANTFFLLDEQIKETKTKRFIQMPTKEQQEIIKKELDSLPKGEEFIIDK